MLITMILTMATSSPTNSLSNIDQFHTWAQPLATFLAGSAVAFGAWLGFIASSKTRQTMEDTSIKTDAREREAHQRSHNLSVAAARQERFFKVADQLSHKDEPVRLAGVYALSALADEWQDAGQNDQRDVCVELICSYLRTRSAKDEEREISIAIVAIIRNHTLDELDSHDPFYTDKDLEAWPIPLPRWPGSLINLRGVSLVGANLGNTNLGGANLEGANLKNADLNRANLRKANLKKADLSNSFMEGVKLEGADAEEINLKDADLSEATLENAYLERANLSGVGLYKAHLKKCYLVEANLSGASLRRADLEGAELEKADLTNAELELAELTDVGLENADMTGANLKSAFLFGAGLWETVLVGAQLQDANFQEAILTHINLQGADMTGADFEGAQLEDVNLRDSTLNGVNFTGAFLENVDLTGAHLGLSGTDEVRLCALGGGELDNSLITVQWTNDTSWPENFDDALSRQITELKRDK